MPHEKPVEHPLQGPDSPFLHILVSKENDTKSLADRLPRSEKCTLYTVPGESCTDKSSLLNVWANRLNFPEYFDHNWDALVDCLREVCGAVSHSCVVFISNADQVLSSDEQGFRILLEILDTVACENVAEQGKCMRRFSRKKPTHFILHCQATKEQKLTQLLEECGIPYDRTSLTHSKE